VQKYGNTSLPFNRKTGELQIRWVGREILSYSTVLKGHNLLRRVTLAQDEDFSQKGLIPTLVGKKGKALKVSRR
jgi:hypothetical protein